MENINSMAFLFVQVDDEQTGTGCDNPGGVGNTCWTGVLEVLLVILTPAWLLFSTFAVTGCFI